MKPDNNETYDVIIIGAGPAGLSAAIYTSREDMKTLVLERGVIGGMAALTATIDNYPGFADGIGGLELSDQLFAQAKRFGANVAQGVEVAGLTRDDEMIKLQTSQGDIHAASVIIATGSSYKKLGIPGETEMTGRGVHYCATCDGPLYRDKNVIVVGGGNSAVQESLFLAKFAKQVTILVRGTELKASAVLIHQLKKLENVEVIFGAVTESITTKDNRVMGVKGNLGGVSHEWACDGVFVFIGLTANTSMFAASLNLDGRGFVMSDVNYGTAIPGVFVAGDVRSGSTWQIASAVGEGAAAALAVRAYFEAAGHAVATAEIATASA